MNCLKYQIFSIRQLREDKFQSSIRQNSHYSLAFLRFDSRIFPLKYKIFATTARDWQSSSDLIIFVLKSSTRDLICGCSSAPLRRGSPKICWRGSFRYPRGLEILYIAQRYFENGSVIRLSYYIRRQGLKPISLISFYEFTRRGYRFFLGNYWE